MIKVKWLHYKYINLQISIHHCINETTSDFFSSFQFSSFSNDIDVSLLSWDVEILEMVPNGSNKNIQV